MKCGTKKKRYRPTRRRKKKGGRIFLFPELGSKVTWVSLEPWTRCEFEPVSAFGGQQPIIEREPRIVAHSRQ